MTIIKREEWGGPSAPFGDVMQRAATSVTVHHPFPHQLPIGATAAQEINEIRKIHRFHDIKWLGIGYNFIITLNGTVYEGRGWGRVGAHAGTTQGNQTSYGIAFLINGQQEIPSDDAAAAFEELRMQGIARDFLSRDHSIKLHRDWKQTDCPGDALAAWARAQNKPAPRVLRIGMKGTDVLELQKQLRVTPTGYYGPITAGAVRRLQRKHGLAADGVYGPLTRAKLEL